MFLISSEKQGCPWKCPQIEGGGWYPGKWQCGMDVSLMHRFRPQLYHSLKRIISSLRPSVSSCITWHCAVVAQAWYDASLMEHRPCSSKCSRGAALMEELNQMSLQIPLRGVWKAVRAVCCLALTVSRAFATAGPLLSLPEEKSHR